MGKVTVILKEQVLSQPELSSLINELNLSKKSVELLASRLAENNFFQPGTKVIFSQKNIFIDLFLKGKGFCFAF